MKLYIAITLLMIPSSTLLAHLGVVHPDGEHDYFPDFPISPLNDQIYFQNVLNVVGSRDIEEIPDGSGRFLSIRGINQVKLTAPGRESERSYVRTGDENVGMTEGATSLAIHPGFATPGDPGFGKFYTASLDLGRQGEVDFESRNTLGFSHYVLTEWTQEDIRADSFSGTSREIMRVDQGSVFHNLNHLLFGPDGYLYVALGEDTLGSQAADLSSIYGKVLRIDPLGTNSANGEYGIPENNPFFGVEDAAPEVFAYGLRNPWRIAFDRQTSDLYAFDVGLDSIEEVSHIEAGLNYGWPRKEGSFLAEREVVPDEPDADTGLTIAETYDLVDPIFELDHTDTNSIIGGVVYRGERFPELLGKVIFGSWNSHDIFVGDPVTGETQILVEGSRLKEFMNNISFVSINQDLDGEIYIAGGLKIVSLFAMPDFDNSGALDTADVDQICNAFDSESSRYDLNGDLQVDADDIDMFLEFADSLAGDLDLDGSVEFQDFLVLARNFGDENVHWSGGDLDCSGTVEFTDFLGLADHFGMRRADLVSVPEAHMPVWLLIGLVCLRLRRLREL